MATPDTWYSQVPEKDNSSTIVTLTDSIPDNNSDTDNLGTSQDPTQTQTHQASGGTTTTPQSVLMDAVKTQMAETVWQTGRQQARKAFDLYGNIDLLRPYFDVEPRTVVHRLALSLLPLRPSGTPQKAVGELYGPLMIVLTLIAILLMGMKDAGHTVRDGTLMGTASGIVFGYWFLASGLYYGVSFICNTHINFLQVLSLTGYGMFSFCLVLFTGTVLHSTMSHTLFYTTWIIIGLLSTLRMVGVYLSRTNGRSHKLTIASIVAVLHLLFLLYLHFAYHKIVEDAVVRSAPLASFVNNNNNKDNYNNKENPLILEEKQLANLEMAHEGLAHEGVALKGVAHKGVALKGTLVKGALVKGAPVKGVPVKSAPVKSVAQEGVAKEGVAKEGVAQKDSAPLHNPDVGPGRLAAVAVDVPPRSPDVPPPQRDGGRNLEENEENSKLANGNGAGDIAKDGIVGGKAQFAFMNKHE